MKFSNLHHGEVELQASAGTDSGAFTDSNVLNHVHAAGVKILTPSGRRVYIKATEDIYVSGEPIVTGEYVQVPESDAKRLVAQKRAVIATDEEVADARKPAAKK